MLKGIGTHQIKKQPSKIVSRRTPSCRFANAILSVAIASGFLLFSSSISFAKHTASRVVYGPEHLYVTVKGQRTIYVVDHVQNRLLEKVSVKSPPCGGFISKDGTQFFVALGELDQIAIINTTTHKIEAEISLKQESGRYLDPGGMAISPDGATIYVANESGDSLSIVDLSTQSVRAHIPVGFGPQDVALTPDGRYAYITDFYATWVVNTQTNAKVAKIALRESGSEHQRTALLSDGEEVFRGPRDIVMSPDGKRAYVALEDSGEIAILDTESNRVEKTVSVGSYPGGLALSPDGKVLYFAHRDSDLVSVMDTAQAKVVRKIRVGKHPWDIALSPTGDQMFVVNQGEPSISVIDTKSFEVKATIILGMMKLRNILPRGLRRMFYVWRKERKRVRRLPFASAIYAVFFLLPFMFTMLTRYDTEMVRMNGTLAGTIPEYRQVNSQLSTHDPQLQRGSPPSLNPSPLGGEGRVGGRMIAFESRRTGNWEIYLMNSDGTGQLRLTRTNAENRAPFWSPDGIQMAFVSTRDGNREIYRMSEDGSDQFNLTRSHGEDFSPSWSPDGKKIAFVSTRDGQRDVYVMDIDGNRQRRLTSHGDNWNPNWSPDSRQLAFVSNRDGNNEIYIMDRKGKGQTSLTKHPAEDGRGSHSWSPDGSKIAWVTNRDGNWDIYIMNADGSHPLNVTRHPAEEGIGMFVWSPDGKQIAFISKRDSNEEVYVVNADGTGSSNLSRSPGMDDVPLWSPDGQKLAFVSNRTGYDEIYVMNTDGSHQLQLTFTRSREDYPRWQP